MDPYAAGVIFFLVLQIVAASLRVYVRACMVKNFGWDDAAMLFTLLLACAFDCIVLGIAHLTGLQTLVFIKPTNLVPAIRMTLAVECIYIWAATWLKLALGLLLLRVLVARWQRMTIYAIMTVCSVYGCFYFFFILFQCGDPQNFPFKIVLRKCLSPLAIDTTSYIHAAMNALADCAFLCLPFALLWKADMSRRAKMSVIAILGIGSVGGIVSAVRIGYIDTLTKPTITYFQTSRLIVLMSSAELSIGLTCICLSTLKPLVSKLWPRSSSYYLGPEIQPNARRPAYVEMSDASIWRQREHGKQCSQSTTADIASEVSEPMHYTKSMSVHPLRLQPPV